MQSLKLRNRIQKLYNFCLKLYNRIAQMASNLAYLILNECDSLHGNQKSKAEGEIRTRVVASTGP